MKLTACSNLSVSYRTIGRPAACFLFMIFFVTGVIAQNPADDVLRRMDANNKALKTLTASIKLSKYNSQIDEYDLREGDLKYIPGSSQSLIHVRIDWAKPIVERMAIGKGQYILYKPKLNQAIIGSINGVKGHGAPGGALAFMSMSRAQLRQNYSAVYKGIETLSGGTQSFHLELTPKATSKYKSVDLWVDVNGMPVQIKLVEMNNDSTTVLLYNLKKNAAIRGDVFAIKAPKGATVIPG